MAMLSPEKRYLNYLRISLVKNKIIHINSSSSGGAFSFVKLLNDSLNENGCYSRILTRFFENRSENIFKHSVIGNRSLKRFLRKIFCPSSLNRERAFEIFSPPLISSSVLKKKMVKNSDIIHIHWVADLLSVSEIAEISKTKKVLWTLHDMNPFTGGCHHSDECQQYVGGCKNCPQLVNEGEKVAEYLKIKKEAFDKIDSGSLTIISPSEWMFDKASKSALLKKFKHILIPHFVDTNVFKYMEKNEARKLLELPMTKKIFLYVSAVLENKRKGFDKVIEMAEQSKERNDVIFLFIGNTKNDLLFKNRKNIRLVGNIDDSKTLSNYYSASDFLINLSVAESFGLTTVESLCCGTLVICHDIPIMREHIQNGVNGIFVKDAFTDFISQSFDGKKIAENAMKKYGRSNFEKYVELYER